MPDFDAPDLVQARHDGHLSRRSFVQCVTAMGISGGATILGESALAQPATPTRPTLSPGATRSFNREDYLAAVQRAFPFEPPRARGGHVVQAVAADIATLNPVVAVDGFSAMVNSNLFSTIVKPSVIDGSWAPDLADSWDISSDGTVYTFHLNHDARWHDGVPLTAHDCIVTLDAVLDESGLSAARSDAAEVVKSYQAIDDHTLELVAQRPVADLLDKSVGGLSIVPRHIWASTPYAEWGAASGATGSDPAQVIGSGPFRFGEWVRGDHVSILRNDDYWVAALVPVIDRFTLQVLPDAHAAVQSLMVGETDICSVPVGQYAALRADRPEFTYVIYDNLGWASFTMNGDSERGSFFTDPRVRQAMLYALDRNQIVQHILNGMAVRADGIYPPASYAYAPDRVTTIYNHDPVRARSLLDAAGWIDDGDGVRRKDGVIFRREILYGDAGPFGQQIVTYLQQAWGKIGVDVRTMSVPFPVRVERETTGDFEIVLHGWGGVGDDLGILYRCDAFPPHGYNIARICNSEFDRLNDESLFELDPDKRRELLIEQGNVVNDSAHTGLLHFTKTVLAAQPRVRNVHANAYQEIWSHPWMWLAGDE
ncbi:MAG: ABC transporter substrate-binding protein [Chloroflexota bacterium]|nr:ABC transporter substrate-binding protein [Chloroflexota bacterium]